MRFRGGIEDAWAIAFVVFLLGFLGVMGFYITFAIITKIMEFDTLNSLPATFLPQATGLFTLLDSMSAFALITYIIGACALAFYARSRPYLAILAGFTQTFFIIGSYILKVFWEAFTTATPEINAVAVQNFPIAMSIMNYLPFISFITMLAIIVLYFTKPSQEYAAGV